MTIHHKGGAPVDEHSLRASAAQDEHSPHALSSTCTHALAALAHAGCQTHRPVGPDQARTCADEPGSHALAHIGSTPPSSPQAFPQHLECKPQGFRMCRSAADVERASARARGRERARARARARERGLLAADLEPLRVNYIYIYICIYCGHECSRPGTAPCAPSRGRRRSVRRRRSPGN
jgi:rubrerythrin